MVQVVTNIEFKVFKEGLSGGYYSELGTGILAIKYLHKNSVCFSLKNERVGTSLTLCAISCSVPTTLFEGPCRAAEVCLRLDQANILKTKELPIHLISPGTHT